MSFCSSCGAPYAPGAKFCSKCGNALESVVVAVAHEPPGRVLEARTVSLAHLEASAGAQRADKVLSRIVGPMGLIVVVGLVIANLTDRKTPVEHTRSPEANEAAAKEEVARQNAALDAHVEQVRRSAAPTVNIGDVLTAYRENEVGADATYHDKWIVTRGHVKRIGKDMWDTTYLILGDAVRYAADPAFQCYLSKEQTGSAARLRIEDIVTVRAKIRGLSMMNVRTDKCEIQ